MKISGKKYIIPCLLTVKEKSLDKYSSNTGNGTNHRFVPVLTGFGFVLERQIL